MSAGLGTAITGLAGTSAEVDGDAPLEVGGNDKRAAATPVPPADILLVIETIKAVLFKKHAEHAEKQPV
jgi:hypothetical protein